MKFYVVVSLLVSLVTSTPLPNSQQKQPSKSKCPNYCAGTAYNATLSHTYVCGDSRLGPVRLPSRLPIFDLIDDYSRFGDLCPGAFLAKWYNETAKAWIYPSQNGYLLNTQGAPIQGNVTLKAGLLLDRFGSEYGSFVSPEGAPYQQRSLPPSNLNTPPGDVRYPANYRVYRVVKDFDALAGPIAGWFGQPGQGVQYQLYSNVLGLLNGEYLVAVKFKDL